MKKKIYFIDLFCGAGGVTTGIMDVDPENVQVIACINHDEKAIASHYANHSNVKHFKEDIRTFDVSILGDMARELRSKEPECEIHIWASLECTNFSIAKGGKPRNADSRTLADFLPKYINEINPDGLWIENVKEFMSWGPLDEKGKPVSRKNGRDYIRWTKNIQNLGYDFDYRIMNCADYGAYTSRVRYFGVFLKKGRHISFPNPTHAKKPESGMFGSLKKWKPVREVLSLHDTGKSIFNRKRGDLSDRTLERILSGLKKFGGETFIQQYYSGNPNDKVKPLSIPCPTITTIPHESLVFLTQYNGNSDTHSINKPIGTLTTKDRFGKVDIQFLDMQYGNGFASPLSIPSPTITTNPKHNIITSQYIFNPAYKSKGSSINAPCCTIVARQDKAPLGLLTSIKDGNFVYKDTDSETMKTLKEYMRENNIGDIRMRMLHVSELKLITGFTEDYELIGNQGDQKKFIGNAVPPKMVKALISHYVAA